MIRFGDVVGYTGPVNHLVNMPRNHKITGKPTNEVFHPDFVDWAKDSLHGHWQVDLIDNPASQYHPQVRLKMFRLMFWQGRFELENDAILFKLRWWDHA